MKLCCCFCFVLLCCVEFKTIQCSGDSFWLLLFSINVIKIVATCPKQFVLWDFVHKHKHSAKASLSERELNFICWWNILQIIYWNWNTLFGEISISRNEIHIKKPLRLDCCGFHCIIVINFSIFSNCCALRHSILVFHSIEPFWLFCIHCDAQVIVDNVISSLPNILVTFIPITITDRCYFINNQKGIRLHGQNMKLLGQTSRRKMMKKEWEI